MAVCQNCRSTAGANLKREFPETQFDSPLTTKHIRFFDRESKLQNVVNGKGPKRPHSTRGVAKGINKTGVHSARTIDALGANVAARELDRSPPATAHSSTLAPPRPSIVMARQTRSASRWARLALTLAVLLLAQPRVAEGARFIKSLRKPVSWAFLAKFCFLPAQKNGLADKVQGMMYTAVKVRRVALP